SSAARTRRSCPVCRSSALSFPLSVAQGLLSSGRSSRVDTLRHEYDSRTLRSGRPLRYAGAGMHPRRSLAGIVRRTALVTLLGMPAIARAGGPVTEPAIAFDAASAVAANGPIPTTNALATCGSNTDSYLAELLHVFPTDAKVTKHWPEIEPGHLLLLSGTVTDSSLGSGDLPFD